jgi:hypothetical protein
MRDLQESIAKGSFVPESQLYQQAQREVHAAREDMERQRLLINTLQQERAGFQSRQQSQELQVRLVMRRWSSMCAETHPFSSPLQYADWSLLGLQVKQGEHAMRMLALANKREQDLEKELQRTRAAADDADLKWQSERVRTILQCHAELPLRPM